MARHRAGSRTEGFTLVELVVVILVAAILFAIGVPTYQAQIRKSRRTDAKTALLDLAARQEKYFSLYNGYTTSPASLGYASMGSGAAFPQLVGSGYYQVTVCVSGSANGVSSTQNACTGAGSGTTGISYVVAAMPVAGTSQASDSSCQYFAVDNTGTQYASSTTGIGTDTTTTCWQ